MPTGYTEIIEKGCTFEEYLWRCARGMGALIMMRDERMDAPIPERFEPATYHAEHMREAEARLKTLKAMSESGARAAMMEDRQQKTALIDRLNAERIVHLDRYQQMRAKVADWQPPTAEHAGLKTFMLQQIDLCTRDMKRPFDAPTFPERTPVEWVQDMIAATLKDLEYAAREAAAEITRTESRNRWLSELRKSVPPPGGLEGREP